MNILKRSIAFILALSLLFTGIVTVSAQDELAPEDEVITEEINHFDNIELGSTEEYKNFLLKFSRPSITTEQFLNFMNVINFIGRLMTGRIFIPERHFNITVDAFTQEISNHINENTGIDLVAFAQNLPDISRPVDLATDILRLDTTAIRDEFYAKRDEIYANGDEAMSYFYHFLGIYFSVISECEIYSAPVESRENTTELIIRFHFKDGNTEDFYPGVYINTETGEFTNRDDSGMFGSGFNFNLNQAITYATVNCWMRNFGFCVTYDILANSMPLFFRYNTRRFHFEYDGLEWMIQIWKGNYLIANGGEVGLYNRDPANKFASFYNCATDDQLLDMSLQIYAGDELLVNKETQPHWWVNGFSLSNRIYVPASLTMKFTVTMRDEEMLNAFTEAIDKNIMNDVYYTVDGLTVYVIW